MKDKRGGSDTWSWRNPSRSRSGEGVGTRYEGRAAQKLALASRGSQL